MKARSASENPAFQLRTFASFSSTTQNWTTPDQEQTWDLRFISPQETLNGEWSNRLGAQSWYKSKANLGTKSKWKMPFQSVHNPNFERSYGWCRTLDQGTGNSTNDGYSYIIFLNLFKTFYTVESQHSSLRLLGLLQPGLRTEKISQGQALDEGQDLHFARVQEPKVKHSV